MQACLGALKRQMNVGVRAKHNIWIDKRPMHLSDWVWFSASLPRSSHPHSRTIIHQCGTVFLVSFPAAIQSINRFTSRKFELFIASESILARYWLKQVSGPPIFTHQGYEITSNPNWKKCELQICLISGVWQHFRTSAEGCWFNRRCMQIWWAFPSGIMYKKVNKPLPLDHDLQSLIRTFRNPAYHRLRCAPPKAVELMKASWLPTDINNTMKGKDNEHLPHKLFKCQVTVGAAWFHLAQ